MGGHLSPEFVDRYRDKKAPFGFHGLGYVVYKRTYARPKPDGHSEEWHETLERVVNGAQDIGAGLTSEEAERLYDYLFNLKGSVSGRALWQMGTENNWTLGGDSLVNCWFTELASVDDFVFLFNELMLGGGVGYSVADPAALGAVHGGVTITHEETKDADFIVPDSREGWAELLRRALNAYLRDGKSFSYSTVLVRPEGAPIRGFGGTASGPGILIDGIGRIAGVLAGAAGRELRSTEVLDIANIIGSIVVSGNVRRSAQIAIGAPDDLDYLAAKRWDQGNIPSWRAMSNNSVYAASVADLPDEFWAGYEGNGEPYGLVNIETARLYGRMNEVRLDPSAVGFNPCAEIPLGNHESCNLAEVFLPNVESLEEFIDLAQLLYKVQKAVAAMPFLDEKTQAIAARNMRLGLSVTGVLQCDEARIKWLDPAYRALRKFDREWSAEKGYPESIRLTTVKPSGTLSLLAGVTPGAHPGFSEFHIRRVRMAANDPLVNPLRKAGYPVEFVRDFEGEADTRTVVVEFPASFPDHTVFAEDITAIQQLKVVRLLQERWADNAVSITVYYTPEELPGVKAWLADNWNGFKSVSFLRKSDHGFDQAPLEAISEDEFRARLASIDAFEFEHVVSDNPYDDGCEGGACPIR